MSTAPKREEVAWQAPTPSAAAPTQRGGIEDVRRTAPSASWAPSAANPIAQAVRAAVDDQSNDAGADAADGTLSVSVVFEPDMVPAGAPPPPEDPSHSPADDEAPSLSVSVVFEPDVNPIHEIVREHIDPPATIAEASPHDEPFFDDALMNLPAMSFDEYADTAALAGAPVDGPASQAPSSDGRSLVVSVPLDTPRSATDAPIASADIQGPLFDDDDDDDFETLIRAPKEPSQPHLPVLKPLPAAGRPIFVPPPDAQDYTPTAQSLPASTHGKSSTGHGRKKKTTKNKRPDKKSRHRIDDVDADADADAETAARHGFPVDDPATSSRRGSRSDTDPLEGRRIADAKYVIDTLIGAGAAGAVYKATHRDLRRTVAIKVLHPHYQEDPHFMKSFKGEALAASQIDHPNVMRVLDFGVEPDGLVYIVMEFLSGRTLQSLLDEERRLPPERAVEIMVQVCAALSAARPSASRTITASSIATSSPTTSCSCRAATTKAPPSSWSRSATSASLRSRTRAPRTPSSASQRRSSPARPSTCRRSRRAERRSTRGRTSMRRESASTSSSPVVRRSSATTRRRS
jgi:hypothetical protein